MTSGQTATTKNQRMKRAIKFPQCPPSAATKVAGAKYEYEKLAGGKEALLNETGVAHRLATPDEMAGPIVFLGFDCASFISGIDLCVDYADCTTKVLKVYGGVGADRDTHLFHIFPAADTVTGALHLVVADNGTDRGHGVIAKQHVTGFQQAVLLEELNDCRNRCMDGTAPMALR